MWVWQSPKAKELGFQLRGPIVVYRTQRGKKAMERIGSYRKLCKIFAIFSNAVSVILMGVMVLFMATAVRGIPLRIKGVTSGVSLSSFGIDYGEFLIFGVFALIVAMVLHEFAHGVQSKSNGVRVESSGLMYAVVPLGAFVEMNEEDADKATLKEKMSIYSAGISINFIIATISFILLAMMMLAPLGNAAGINDDDVGIYATTTGSPADLIGLSTGSVILKIDGNDVYIDGNVSNEIYRDGNVLGGGIYEIEFLTPKGAVKENMWLGVYVESVVEDGAAQIAGLPEKFLIMSIDGEAITGPTSFSEFLKTTSPGDTIKVTYADVVTGIIQYDREITLHANGDIGYMGVRTTYSGIVSMTTPGFVMGKASNPIYGETTVFGMLNSALKYPFLSMEGFSPVPKEFRWWYEAPGGSVFWTFGVMIYWMFWVNLLLGITNALPLLPFDGGFLFRGWVMQALEKMDYKTEEIREEVADNISRAVSGFMGFLLILIIFAAIFPGLR